MSDTEQRRYNVSSAQGGGKDTEVTIERYPVESMVEQAGKKACDPVNHPAHYTHGGVEVLDCICEWKLSYHEGNVLKYVVRARHKGDELEDLRKARFYLQSIEALRKEEYCESTVPPMKQVKDAIAAWDLAYAEGKALVYMLTGCITAAIDTIDDAIRRLESNERR